MPRLWRLICVCTVCQLPFYGSSDYNCLRAMGRFNCFSAIFTREDTLWLSVCYHEYKALSEKESTIKGKVVPKAYKFFPFRVHFFLKERQINFDRMASPESISFRLNHMVTWNEWQCQKCTVGHVRTVKIQISLCNRAGWSESSLGAIWIAKDARFLHTDKVDSDQTAWMRRLIWVRLVHMSKGEFSRVEVWMYHINEYDWWDCGSSVFIGVCNWAAVIQMLFVMICNFYIFWQTHPR